MDIWYDQWTPGDTTGTKIYIATMTSTDDFYSELDTSSDTLSTAVDATTGAALTNYTNAAGQNFPSITKGTDGKLYIGEVDNSEQAVIRCSTTCTTGSNWAEIGAGNTVFATVNAIDDSLLLMPLASANVLAIALDDSAEDILSYVWSSGGSSWSGSTLVDGFATTSASYNPTYAATLNKSTNDIDLIYGADVGVANTGDVRSAVYSSGAWTRKTDVATNISYPTGAVLTNVGAAFDSNNGFIYAAYEKSTTTPDTLTANGAYPIYYKRSNDGMTTWSQEFGPFSSTLPAGGFGGLGLNFLSPFKIYATWFDSAMASIYGAVFEDRLSFGQESRLTLTGNVKFLGDLSISGALAKSAGTFVIDDPLAPRTKLLYHSFVESPDAKNLYDGIAKLNGSGEVTIRLPAYFELLNKDFRYQFFPLYDAMPGLYIKQEVKDNAFVIAGGKPGGEISWQVTGNRHDPYILAHPIIPEVEKSDSTPVKKGVCIYAPLCL